MCACVCCAHISAQQCHAKCMFVRAYVSAFELRDRRDFPLCEYVCFDSVYVCVAHNLDLISVRIYILYIFTKYTRSHFSNGYNIVWLFKVYVCASR